MEFRPTSSGDLFLTGSYSRNIELPGVKINIMKGPGVLKGDYPFSGDLYVSQQERALLENLQPSKKIGPSSKSLTLPEIEERLDQIVRVNGEEALNAVRDRGYEISEELGMQNEYEKLNRIISAILTTRPSDLLTSLVAIARAFGHPYDPNRLARCSKNSLSSCNNISLLIEWILISLSGHSETSHFLNPIFLILSRGLNSG